MTILMLKIGDASVRDWLYVEVFQRVASPINASLLFAVTFMLACSMVGVGAGPEEDLPRGTEGRARVASRDYYGTIWLHDEHQLISRVGRAARLIIERPAHRRWSLCPGARDDGNVSPSI